MTQNMARRTIYLPDSIEELVRGQALEGESFSATIVRLVELSALTGNKEDWPDYIGAVDGGPRDLGINAEKYLGLKPWGPDEGPEDQSPR
jgi:hypothetical protein